MFFWTAAFGGGAGGSCDVGSAFSAPDSVEALAKASSLASEFAAPSFAPPHPCRSHSCAGLSYLKCANTACRRNPSGVHSRYFTSQTCVGSTQVVVFVSGILSLSRG